MKANIDGVIVTFKAKFEFRYAQYLDTLKGLGEIVDWDYEGLLSRCPFSTFYFKDVKTAPVQYTPDFWVLWKDEAVEYHETKGYLGSYDITKYRRMKEQYPRIRLVVLFMRRPKKVTAKRLRTLQDNTHRIIYNAGKDIFTPAMRGLIDWG